MAKRLDRFTQPFVQSRIPFLLTEVLTDGHGKMTDLVCRFANSAAGTLLSLPPEELTDARFTRRFPGRSLSPLAPLAEVAFSGSSASFPYTTLLGRQITITCYQPVYGMAAVILDSPAEEDASLLAERLPAAACVLELSREGLKCPFFNQRLCQLTGWRCPPTAPPPWVAGRFAGSGWTGPAARFSSPSPARRWKHTDKKPCAPGGAHGFFDSLVQLEHCQKCLCRDLHRPQGPHLLFACPEKHRFSGVPGGHFPRRAEPACGKIRLRRMLGRRLRGAALPRRSGKITRPA